MTRGGPGTVGDAMTAVNRLQASAISACLPRGGKARTMMPQAYAPSPREPVQPESPPPNIQGRAHTLLVHDPGLGFVANYPDDTSIAGPLRGGLRYSRATVRRCR